MADLTGTPTLNPTDSAQAGPAPAAAPSSAAKPPASPYPDPAGTKPSEVARGQHGVSTDPTQGMGVVGEEDVWKATYSLKNFVGRIAFLGIFTVAWIVLAVDTWGYNHAYLAIPTTITGIVLGFFWVLLVARMIRAKLGHYYRLTNRRLFVSTGVVHRERDQMELIRVQDVFTRQVTLLERMLKIGTVVVVSSEKALPTYYLPGVTDPKRVMDLIWHHARSEQDQRNVRIEGV